MALSSNSLGQKRVDTCRWTAIIAAVHAQETTQTLYISIFDSLFRVRYVCLRDDYNFDKTMLAPLKKEGGQKRPSEEKKGLVLTYFFCTTYFPNV